MKLLVYNKFDIPLLPTMHIKNCEEEGGQHWGIELQNTQPSSQQIIL